MQELVVTLLFPTFRWKPHHLTQAGNLCGTWCDGGGMNHRAFAACWRMFQVQVLTTSFPIWFPVWYCGYGGVLKYSSIPWTSGKILYVGYDSFVDMAPSCFDGLKGLEFVRWLFLKVGKQPWDPLYQNFSPLWYVWIIKYIWANYNDLSQGHLEWWFSQGIPPQFSLIQV